MGEWYDTESGTVVTSRPEEGVQIVAGSSPTADEQARLDAYNSAGTGGSPKAVEVTGAPSDGDSPVWNASADRWEPGAPSGGSSPLPANATGATTDSLSPDPVTGSDDVTVVVVPADCSVLAVKIEGDDFPRLLVKADPTDYAFLMLGDGTADPYNSPLAYIGVDGTSLQVATADETLTLGTADGNRGTYSQIDHGLRVGGDGIVVFTGNNAPTIGGAIGDVYIRRNGTAAAGTRYYKCTASGAAGVAVWEAEAPPLPGGGATGQVLTKNSETDFDVAWIDLP